MGDHASLTTPKQCSGFRKNDYILLKGQPCKIVEMSTSKTGKHGHAKVHLVGIHIFKGNKVEDICPSTHNMECPNVTRIEYQVIGVEDDFVSLMSSNGDVRPDLKCSDKALLEQISNYMNAEGAFVTVLKSMNEEKIITCKKDSSN